MTRWEAPGSSASKDLRIDQAGPQPGRAASPVRPAGRYCYRAHLERQPEGKQRHTLKCQPH